MDPASPTTAIDDRSRSGGPPVSTGSTVPARGATIAAVLMGVGLATTGLGLLVGLNQLATQSPVDAILPVAAFSVGATGVLTMLAATLDPFAARLADRGVLEPPPIEEGFLHFGIGLAAIASVGWRWGLTSQASIVGAYAVYQLLVTELGVVTLLFRRQPPPDAVRIGLTAATGVLLGAFAWAALADAGVRPFS